MIFSKRKHSINGGPFHVKACVCVFTFKLLLAKVHFPFNEGHACKLCHRPLVDVQSWEVSSVLVLLPVVLHVYVCICFQKGGVMSSVRICTPPSLISSGKIGISTHSSHLHSAQHLAPMTWRVECITAIFTFHLCVWCGIYIK